MRTNCSLLIALGMFVACSASAQTAQLIVTAPSALAGSYAAVTYNEAPSNVTSTTPIAQGDFFVYDGVDCTAHTLTKPVAGSGTGKIALLTGSYPASCTYYDDVVRELQQDGVVAVVFGLANGTWRDRLLHGNVAGLSVPVLYMQVDEVSKAIRTAVVGGATVSASFVAVTGMDMNEVVDWYVAGETRTYGLVPWGSNPSTGATWDMSTLDWDRTTPGVQQSLTLPPGTCGGTSFNYDPITQRVTSTVPAGSTFTGSCSKTYLVRDTSGYQGIGLIWLYIGVPYARSDTAQTTAGTAVAIDVLANDYGAAVTKDATRLDLYPTTTAVDQALSTVEGNWSVSGGKVVFVPAAGFIGRASIQYVVRGANGGSSNSATISVNVGIATPDLNQHGLTGSYYEPATSGQGVELEVYPDLSAPGTGLAFMSWFTYDSVVGGAERQRWYTAEGPVVTGQPNATLTIYQNTGGNFNAPPTTAANAVGTATLSFDSCTSGLLSYNFTDGTGRTGSIPLSRLTQNMTCSTTSARPTNADFGFSGNWYDPATSGQGITVEVNPSSKALFLAWYTYAPNGAGAGPAGQRWYTAEQTTALVPGARTIPVQLYETTGGSFDTPTSPAPNTVVVGSGTIAFQSCSSATLIYNFTGGSSSGASGTIALKRVGPVPAGCAL